MWCPADQKRPWTAAAIIGTSVGGCAYALRRPSYKLLDASEPVAHAEYDPEPRQAALNRLSRSPTEPLDLLVIGGGAVGAGAALEAQSRGFSVGLVEMEDFGAGASSKSTKLLHGGVRYLEQAIQTFDFKKLGFVAEGLQERASSERAAPHLTRRLATVLACYDYSNLLRMYAGMKVYDALSIGSGFPGSTISSPRSALQEFPTLADEDERGRSLKGAVVCGFPFGCYGSTYDSHLHQSARLSLLTDIGMGSLMMPGSISHSRSLRAFRVPRLPTIWKLSLSGEKTRRWFASNVAGQEGAWVQVKDTLSGRDFDVLAKEVIICTGALTNETVSALSSPNQHNENASSFVAPSAGTHVTLPRYYAPNDKGAVAWYQQTSQNKVESQQQRVRWRICTLAGLIVTRTKDGRVAFVLPFKGKAIAGTTDAAAHAELHPKPSSGEIRQILDNIRPALSVDVRPEDVLSTWSGLRPLAATSGTSKSSTAKASRDHAIVRDNHLGATVAFGGKWTNWRVVARDAVDHAVATIRENAGRERIKNSGKRKEGIVPLVGSCGYRPNLAARLARENKLPEDVADHLARSYGDRAVRVARIAAHEGRKGRLAKGHPIIEAEVVHAARSEMCATASDFLVRRCGLVFLDQSAAMAALPRVVRLLAGEHGWGLVRQFREWRSGCDWLSSFRADLPLQ